jgi:hypothetical protein
MTTTEIDPPTGPPAPTETPSPRDMRGEIRRRRLRGTTTYACRECRAPIRVVGAAGLPDACPACGHDRPTPDGRGIWRKLKEPGSGTTTKGGT